MLPCFASFSTLCQLNLFGLRDWIADTMRATVVEMFGRVNATLGRRIAHATEADHMHRDQQQQRDAYRFENKSEQSSAAPRCPFSFQSGGGECPASHHKQQPQQPQQQRWTPDVVVREDDRVQALKTDADWDMSACSSPGRPSAYMHSAYTHSPSPSSTPSHSSGAVYERHTQPDVPRRGNVEDYHQSATRSYTHLRSSSSANAGMFGY